MPSPGPLNPALGTAFRVGDALGEGVSRSRLRRSDLVSPFHGVRAVHGVSRVRAYVPRLRPGDRFSHTTAAALWGAPLPRAVRDDLHVSSTKAQRPRTKHCTGHRSRAIGHSVRDGLPVSAPAQMLIECAGILALDDLVAIADHLLLDPRVLDPHDPRPHATRVQLEAGLAQAHGSGVRRARHAVGLAREGVESPMETLLRLVLERAGIPPAVCGFELVRPGGRTVGWFDLAWPDRRVIAEYDGDQHRTSTRQYDRDIRRFDDAAELGWRVVRVRSRGILHDPEDTVRRVRRALDHSAASQSAP